MVNNWSGLKNKPLQMTNARRAEILNLQKKRKNFVNKILSSSLPSNEKQKLLNSVRSARSTNELNLIENKRQFKQSLGMYEYLKKRQNIKNRVIRNLNSVKTRNTLNRIKKLLENQESKEKRRRALINRLIRTKQHSLISQAERANTDSQFKNIENKLRPRTGPGPNGPLQQAGQMIWF
jgi:hypothetical protein